MEIKQFTDEQYIPINDLISFGDDIVAETKEYRRLYMELVPVNDLDFVNIVETPSLVKKRFAMNVELKGNIEIEADDNDFILKMAIQIIKKNKLQGLSKKEIELLIKKYEANGKDLTIITNYLINNSEKLYTKEVKTDLTKKYPNLKLSDIKFMNKSNDKELNYSLNDYTKINDCSYETSRQALERLIKLELYIKSKVGKKFIYKPTDKLEEIMKGAK